MTPPLTACAESSRRPGTTRAATTGAFGPLALRKAIQTVRVDVVTASDSPNDDGR